MDRARAFTGRCLMSFAMVLGIILNQLYLNATLFAYLIVPQINMRSMCGVLDKAHSSGVNLDCESSVWREESTTQTLPDFHCRSTTAIIFNPFKTCVQEQMCQLFTIHSINYRAKRYRKMKLYSISELFIGHAISHS